MRALTIGASLGEVSHLALCGQLILGRRAQVMSMLEFVLRQRKRWRCQSAERQRDELVWWIYFYLFSLDAK